MIRSADKHRKVLSLLRRNEWDKAHAIVMRMRDKLAFRIHGLLHRIEGDLDNARYWYRRTTREFPGAAAVQREIAAARLALAEEHRA